MAFGQNPSLYGGLPTVPQFQQVPNLHNRLVSASSDDTDGPIWRYRGLVTYEKPIIEFPADIVIPVNAAGSQTTLRSGSELPNNCVGLRFINLTTGVSVSINGGGQRAILANDNFAGVEIQTVIVFTDATGSCTVQSVGTGD